MKKSLGAKTLVYPTPAWVICTFDTNGKPNGMTVAWGGICCSKPPQVTVSLRKATYSYSAIVERRAYTVNVFSDNYVAEVDYFGMASGRDHDKFKDTGLTPIGSDLVDAPYIQEAGLVLECKLVNSFEVGLHTMFVGEILDVKAEEDILSPDGHPDCSKLHPLWYAPGMQQYFSATETVGRGYKVGDKFKQKA